MLFVCSSEFFSNTPYVATVSDIKLKIYRFFINRTTKCRIFKNHSSYNVFCLCLYFQPDMHSKLLRIKFELYLFNKICKKRYKYAQETVLIYNKIHNTYWLHILFDLVVFSLFKLIPGYPVAL